MDPNFEKKEITYYNNRIDLPILNNNINTVLTIKSTNDYFSSNSNNDVSLCTIANEMLKIARPIQVNKQTNKQKKKLFICYN